MIKKLLYAGLAAMVLGLATECQSTQQTDQGADSTSSTAATAEPANDSSLYASLQLVREAPSINDSILIRFTVHNPTQDSLKFTSYHTPFEGFISKFLTVKDSNGNEVAYIGPMAKRIMPPPAATYHSLASGQNEEVVFDLKRGYKIETPGAYTLQYNAENISGIANGDPIQITVTE